MPISVEQAVHEGEKFLATLTLINASFKKCTILIDDTIQRHTLKINSEESEPVLYQQAINAGDAWLGRNAKNWANLKISYNILRWNDWAEHPNFLSSHQRVCKYYASNEVYRADFHSNIKEFLIRHFSLDENMDNLHYQRAFSCCVDYLLEECAVMCLWAQAGYDFEVYPSGRNKAMESTYQYLIAPNDPNHLKSVALRFKKYHRSNESLLTNVV